MLVFGSNGKGSGHMKKFIFAFMAVAMLGLAGTSAEAAGSTATPCTGGFAPCARGAAKVCVDKECTCTEGLYTKAKPIVQR